MPAIPFITVESVVKSYLQCWEGISDEDRLAVAP